MPTRSGFPPLPYLDPEFNPDHPLNHIPKIEDDPYLPLGKRERKRREKEAMELAMEAYEPPHVPRSWETDGKRAEQYKSVMGMVLYSKNPTDYEDLVPSGIYDSSTSRAINQTRRDSNPKDFRQFAATRLHLGYNRFHATHGETHLPSEEPDPTVPPEEFCWIMEYTENECSIIRRRIALAIGLFPAVTDPNNSFFNEEISWRYERRLYCRCRRRNKLCIRPSHIEIFTSSFQILP